jgi:predicted peptidase
LRIAATKLHSSPLHFLLMAFLALCLEGCATIECPPAQSGGVQVAEPANRTRDGRHVLPHLLYVPAMLHNNGCQLWPLMVFLHGSGERGTDIELVKTHGPPKRLASGTELPFIVASPQLPADSRWSGAQIIALIDHLTETTPVDRKRIFLTGLSLGGHGVWEIGAESPDRFTALAPVCGRGDITAACRLREIPIWAFHGDSDEVVPVTDQQSMVDAVRGCGGEVRFSIYENVGHDSWGRTYEDPEFYRWLLSQPIRRQTN